MPLLWMAAAGRLAPGQRLQIAWTGIASAAALERAGGAVVAVAGVLRSQRVVVVAGAGQPGPTRDFLRIELVLTGWPFTRLRELNKRLVIDDGYIPFASLLKLAGSGIIACTEEPQGLRNAGHDPEAGHFCKCREFVLFVQMKPGEADGLSLVFDDLRRAVLVKPRPSFAVGHRRDLLVG